MIYNLRDFAFQDLEGCRNYIVSVTSHLERRCREVILSQAQSGRCPIASNQLCSASSLLQPSSTASQGSARVCPSVVVPENLPGSSPQTELSPSLPQPTQASTSSLQNLPESSLQTELSPSLPQPTQSSTSSLQNLPESSQQTELPCLNPIVPEDPTGPHFDHLLATYHNKTVTGHFNSLVSSLCNLQPLPTSEGLWFPLNNTNQSSTVTRHQPCQSKCKRIWGAFDKSRTESLHIRCRQRILRIFLAFEVNTSILKQTKIEEVANELDIKPDQLRIFLKHSQPYVWLLRSCGLSSIFDLADGLDSK